MYKDGLYSFKEKNAFRATSSSLWVILDSMLLTTQMIDGLFTPHVWLLFGIGAGMGLLSLLIGSLIVPHLSRKVFMKITCVLLLISGATLLF